ncbi:hypothetical protein EB796_004773 [Bugula neritina]|uniref:Uncharacterized protein n=1 Tax=Bugula neritina TaxID=10212 RepID=A0A7J7KHF8_BUGNE|nr:hypothetical protein EB796_004773 [Bugula neritina]
MILMILEECWVFVYGTEHIKKLCSSNVNLKKSNHYDTMLLYLSRGLLTRHYLLSINDLDLIKVGCFQNKDR